MDFNPILAEIQGHMASMSPDAQAVVSKMGGNASPPAAATTAASAPPVIPHGMLLPHTDDGPPPGPISMAASAPTLTMPSAKPQLVTGPNHGQSMMTNGQSVPIGSELGDEAERMRLLSHPAGVDQIAGKIEGSHFGQDHPILGKILGDTAQIAGKIGDTALNLGNTFLPELRPLVQAIPGTTQHHDLLLHNANTALGQDIGNAQKQAQTANETATAGKTNAETPYIAPKAKAGIALQNAEAQAKEPVEITPEQAQTLGMPELAGEKVSPAIIARLSGQHQGNTTHEKVADTNADAKKAVADTNADTNLNIAGLHVKTQKEIADAHNKTLLLLQGMKNEGSAAKGGKVPMTVTNRASLASNVVENVDATEALLSAHPDIVGPAAGRYSNVQQMIGSDDPNIQALGVRIHNIALAGNGMHGQRSAMGVKSTEDELFNHFHAGPNAIRGALEAQRDSTSTFLQDERNFQETGKRTGAPKQGAPPQGGKPNDPLGIR